MSTGLSSHSPQGVLTELHTAFSREEEEEGRRKVYVQHRMAEHGDRLARLMLEVCCWGQRRDGVGGNKAPARTRASSLKTNGHPR